MISVRRPAYAAHSLSTPLFSKQGLVVRDLADELLGRRVDERLPRVQEYGARFSASAGTVQVALDYLQNVGATRLESRGRLGSFARELNYPILWSLATGRPLVGAMPLPYTRRLAGLATSVRAQFERHPLDLDLRFTRGSTNRLQTLIARECDWALVSRYAAETADVLGFAVEPVLLLGPSTYMAGSSLLFAQGRGPDIDDGMRVGIDMQSTDHAYTVRSVSRDRRVSFVEIEYMQGLKLLRSGQIDVTVWSREDIPGDLDGLVVAPIDTEAHPAIARLSEATLIIARGNLAVSHVLQGVLDRDALLQTQQEVVRGARLATY